LHWKSGSEVEWFKGKEAEASLAHATLSGIFISLSQLVKIGNSPSLGWLVSTKSVQCLNWLSFFISSILNGNDLMVLDISEVSMLVLEHLPPS
jgi:hypothetical protein